jgi:filamentous hemagglutinin family protein
VPVLQVFHASLSRLARLSPYLAVSLTAGMALTAPNAAAHGALSERGPAAVSEAVSSIMAGAAQAAAINAQALNALSRAALAIQQMQNLQNSAHVLSMQVPAPAANALNADAPVPDGLQPGGLAPSSTEWTGAQTPAQASAAGQTTVTINQTAAQAILSWNSFNVGKNTTVNFNQQGNTNWVALNRISSGAPSQILGSIKASGQVYLINQNGIIFGGASQVNVGALIASSAAISDAQFTTNGIYSAFNNETYTPSFTGAGGAIDVAAGAQIVTNPPQAVTVGGGFVLLMGTSVDNEGSISTPGGQTELAAGNAFRLRPGYSTGSSATMNPTSTTRGNEIAVVLNRLGSSRQPGGAGLVTNGGIIEADTGDITLAGETVAQNGVALSTTTVATRGTIHLLSSATDKFSSVTLGPASVTLINPDFAASGTALNSQRAALVAQSAAENAARLHDANADFNDLSPLADQEEDSSIEIVTGGVAEFAGGSQTVAPGGEVTVSAVSRIQVDAGALIDVAGSTNVELPISANDVAVNIQSYEQRDAPQNRLTQQLRNNTVYVDTQDLSAVAPTGSATDPSSGDAQARDYTAGGLLEVSGYLGTTPHTLGEWTAIGGTITLSTGASSGAVVVQPGATLNLNGGSIAYQSGYLQQSYLLGENGQVYNVNTAPAYITYAGVYNGFQVDHARWQVTQSFRSAVHAAPEIYQNGYVEGRAAGNLVITSATTLFGGTIEDAVVNGPNQTVAAPADVAQAYDPYTLGQNVIASNAALFVGEIGSSLQPVVSAVNFGAGDAAAAAALSAREAIPVALRGANNFSAAALSADPLSDLTVITDSTITVSENLSLAPGAGVELYGAAVRIGANITAPAGSITISNNFTGLTPKGGVFKPSDDIVVEPGVEISSAGSWTNLVTNPGGLDSAAYINGGAISISSVTSLVIDGGSLIDASAGALITSTLKESGGAGGAITLDTANPHGADGVTGGLDPKGIFKLAGTLQSNGFSRGGVLTLDGGKFALGDTAAPGDVLLQPGFFQSGFSAYDLTGQVTIEPGADIGLTMPIYAFTNASLAAPSGADPAIYRLTPPLYTPNAQFSSLTQRAGASLAINAATLLVPATASITVDPGQTIALQSFGQLTIDGSLTAPGGIIDINENNPIPELPPVSGKLTSIWIAGTARLNVSGAGYTIGDRNGDLLSAAPAGGTIEIGTTPGLGANGAPPQTTRAPVILQAGAVLTASGSAGLDRLVPKSGLDTLIQPAVTPGAIIPLAGSGGNIALGSSYGIYNDGDLIADAGGPNAAGGSLDLAIESDLYLKEDNVADAPRNLTVTNSGQVKLPANLRPGKYNPALTLGTAQISVQQIDQGGFGSVTLSALDAISFAGTVSLALPQEVTLSAGAFTDTSKDGSVTISAPQVVLNGQVSVESGTTEGMFQPDGPVNDIAGYSSRKSTGSFTVNADLLLVENQVRFGGIEALQAGTPGMESTVNKDLAGFGAEQLLSSGDLSFDPVAAGGNDTGTSIITTNSLTLQGSKIYAAAGAATVEAGFDPASNSTPAGSKKTLTLEQPAGNLAQPPLDLGSSLTFTAPVIADGGVVWQPLGQITFNASGLINFLPGSVTSVSAAGLTIPYGGTTDGINYSIDGLTAKAEPSTRNYQLGEVLLTGGPNGGGQLAASPGRITINGSRINVAQGAVLNLSGGGNLTGEGFISGAGGSTDVLYNPLLQVGAAGVTQPSLAADPVYAIVAGPQQEVAPAQLFSPNGTTGSTPALGAQIVIPAGIPGLPAGRYTLLPAAYALDPGGYRVEFDGASALGAAPVVALSNGSFAVAAQSALVNTQVVGATPINLTITPAAQVKNYAQYDTESYSQFLIATTALTGAERPQLPEDAGTLALDFDGRPYDEIANAGTTDLAAAGSGLGGVLLIGGNAAVDSAKVNLEFYGTAPPPLRRSGTVALSATAIDAFQPYYLEIGEAGSSFDSTVNSATLEPGATLTASRVIFTTLTGGVTLLGGSEIDTIGRAGVPFGSTQFGAFNGNGATVLDVGNGYFDYLVASTVGFTQYGPITVDAGAKIFTDGSIAFSTGGSVSVSDAAEYGGLYLDLAVPEINIGNPADLAAAPPGLDLTPAVLQALASGVPAANVPAVQILILAASNSVNFFGTVDLDVAGSGKQLVIDSPAIYGYGGPADVATISSSTIVWNGLLNNSVTPSVSALPGGLAAAQAGTGSLVFNANNIVFGYSSLDPPLRDTPLNRLTLGFSTVNLDATGAISANNQGTLAVYQSQAVYGQPGSGGVLNLNTPLLTAADAASIGYTAGGAINLNSAGVASGPALGAGATIGLTAAAVNLNGTVGLPSGKLDIQAGNDIVFGSAAAIDLAGATSSVLGVATFGDGGSLIAQSTAGNITQAAGGDIDVSAAGAAAGSLQFTATGALGQVLLAGSLRGAGAGGQDGSFTLAAQGLGPAGLNAGFATLNASLNAGSFFAARQFDFKSGDLTVAGGVQASKVGISTDAGSLTVTGEINASGPYAGSITLAAQNNLTLAPGALLEAAATVTHNDQYGQEIAAVDAPQISLTVAPGSAGQLTLEAGAVLDLRSQNGVGQGNLELNVPRLDGAGGFGDAAIEAQNGVTVEGAASIAVNAFAVYNGLPDPTGNTDTGVPDALITQAYLQSIDSTDTQPYMAAALGNGDLKARLAGLDNATYANVFHFRPGVDIVSATANGDLTVQGDIDLSGFRYGSGVIPGVAGSGEPGVLEIRAGGNLNIFGSITDGISAPVNDAGTTPASGWVLYSGTEPFGQDVVIPTAVTLRAGSIIGDGQGDGSATVNYALPLAAGNFSANSVAPVALQVAGRTVVPISFIATSAITAGNGQVLYAKGAVVPAKAVLPNGATIAAGGVLPFSISIGAVTWPAGAPLTDDAAISQRLTLLPGSLIPGSSDINLGSGSVGTRAADAGGAGSQGQIYPLGQLFAANLLSWSIDLVAGADTTAAAPNTLQGAASLAGAGNITLADTHYSGTQKYNSTPLYSVIRTGTGSLDLAAGGSIDEQSDYGVYTAGNSAYAAGAEAGTPFNLPEGKLGGHGTLLGPNQQALAALDADYQANYGQDGGNVSITAQGNLDGFISTEFSNSDNRFSLTDTDAIGAWLWQQGGAGEPGSWWVEEGTFQIQPLTAGFGNTIQLVGFQGTGTLGGGNLTVNVGGDAYGLNLVVASTGRAISPTTLLETGGGNLELSVGGAINGSNFPPILNFGPADGGGLISDLRGNITIAAGSLGLVVPRTGDLPGDPRTLGPLAQENAGISQGIDLAPGDGTLSLSTRGDQVVQSIIDPGTVENSVNTTPVASLGVPGGGATGFTLWSGTTSATLTSAGGDVVAGDNSNALLQNEVNPSQNGVSNFDPPILSVIAQNGNIDAAGVIELAPSASGQLELLAGGSIYGGTYTISGANPAFASTVFDPEIRVSYKNISFTNASANSPITTIGIPSLLAFGPDQALGAVHPLDQAPARVFANLDIVDAGFGGIDITGHTLQVAAEPFDIAAGRDIVASGSLSLPDYFLNLTPADVSSITAGRDIIDSSADVSGPGTLLIQAGRNIDESDLGAFDSLGPAYDISIRNRDGGAGITVIAGSGTATIDGATVPVGLDYALFSSLFLDPATALALPDAGQIVAANDAALVTWLAANDGYTGPPSDAYAVFQTLSAAQQQVFLWQVFFSELNQSGLEYSDPLSLHYKSYILGQDAIAALFPAATASGQAISYAGDLTLSGPSGIQTQFGGNIDVFTPGGATTVGVQGLIPPASAGLITAGNGDINVLSQGSVLLGESRVLTTFGGNILIWSEAGDINAGEGNKNTIDAPPAQIAYDAFGNIGLSPTVPSSGAGIGTLSPIAGVAAGNVNLVAPLGTVDAGEAGIRSSGNLNIAALHVLNTANISVKGTTTGVPVAPAVDVGALTAASNAAAAATNAASAPRSTSRQQPSIWIVEILGYGGQAPPAAKPCANGLQHCGGAPDTTLHSPTTASTLGRFDAASGSG